MNSVPVYLVWHGETMLNAPIERCWPHVLNYTSWQHYPVAQPVSGERGKEGEVVLLKKDEAGFTFPPYYARTIKLEPRRRIIWKTWPETATPELDFFGIVDFTLHEAKGKTRFCYDFLYELLVPARGESELEELRKQQYANTEAMFAAILPKLKKLVEETP